MAIYQIIGLMSGTSTDGLDISYCRYEQDETQKWNFTVLNCKNYPYEKSLQRKIKTIHEASAWDFIQLDQELALHWAKCVNDFLDEFELSINEISCIASHGQTIFHRPQLGITTQIGCGQTLATRTGIPVINDFRTKDVVHGGQGAPLVPIGDLQLFGNEFDAMLNIGGFCNISILSNQNLKAFDICPGNLPLNKLCLEISGEEYDKNGELSSKGKVIEELLQRLNELDYYQQAIPKSLGTEWLEKNFYPLLQSYSQLDTLRTVVEHIAIQIAKIVKEEGVNKLLISGGGAFNTFLLERIKSCSQTEIQLPENQLVEFKEAIIFGFLAALHLANQANCLASVTGADSNVKGGVYYSP